MKTLILVRHAKSSWDSSAATDFDRPLNDRGKHDAPMMAKRLVEQGIKIDAFISSPAKRAKKTAEYFVREYGVKEKHIIYVSPLYGAAPKDFNEIISGIDDKYKSIAIFSHNPGITEFANILSDQLIDNMPTASVFAVKADVKKEFWFFDYPKKV